MAGQEKSLEVLGGSRSASPSRGTLSPKQIEMLKSFRDDHEAADLYDFGSHSLAWSNRERVIDALFRKGLLDEDGITDAGRAALVQAEKAAP